MNILRCNMCEWLGNEHDLISDKCPVCNNSEYLMDLDGTEEYYTDDQLKTLWGIFGDIPMDPNNETIEEKFLCFEIGTNRFDIWKWFDKRYSKGVYELIYG